MSRKQLIWVGVFAGSFLGGYVPSLWGAGMFSFAGIIGSAVGGLLGIYLGFKLGS
jgi:hypothetical protein